MKQFEDIQRRAQGTADAFRALTELANTARHVAALAAQQAAAAAVEDRIDVLTPCVGCTVADVYEPSWRG
jgi:hypothetical protein